MIFCLSERAAASISSSQPTGKYLRCYQVTGNICLKCERQPDCFKRSGSAQKNSGQQLLSCLFQRASTDWDKRILENDASQENMGGRKLLITKKRDSYSIGRMLLICNGIKFKEDGQVPRPFQVGPVDKLKRNGFLYGILIISTAGGHFL